MFYLFWSTLGRAGKVLSSCSRSIARAMHWRRKLACCLNVIAGIAIGGFAAISDARAQAQDFGFRNKTITIVIPIGPGGAYDSYGRLVARHLGKHLPDKPSLVAVNMPGGSGVIASNYTYNVAPRDGTTLAIITSSFATEQVIGNPAIRYDARRFNGIGRLLDTVSTLIIWHQSPIKTLDDTFKRETLVAGSTSAQLTSIRLLAMNRFLGTKFKTITGYPSASDYLLAMERGETDGGCTTYIGAMQLRAADIREGRMKILLQFSRQRGPEMPNIPALGELSDKPEVLQIFNFLSSNDEVGRSLVAPPDVPSDRVAMLRSAFQDMLNDEVFKGEAASRDLPISPLGGEALQALIASTFDISPDALATVRQLMKQ